MGDQAELSRPDRRQARLADTGAVLASRLRLANTHWTRMRGLLGTSQLAEGEGLWIVPCRQIHMFGMRYAVDAVFLDQQGTVVSLIEELQPSRVSPSVAEAHSVLELPAGTIQRCGLQPGSRIEIEGGSDVGDSWVDTAGAVLVNLVLAVFFGFFAVQHLIYAQRTGYWATTLPLVIQEGMLVALFLTRRRSIATSPRATDWLVGMAGTILPLLFRTTEAVSAVHLAGAAMQICGLAIAIVGLASLGRSIGIVAGNRGIKLGGLYGKIRHPMYAGYMLSYTGYVIAYPSARNAAIIAGTLIALVVRAIAEERFLAQEESYRSYLERTRWRFLPFVF